MIRSCSVSIAALSLLVAACGSSKDSDSKSSAAPPVAKASAVSEELASLKLDIPKDGPYGERVRKLWKQTQDIITADWNKDLPYPAAKKRHVALYDAWVKLQIGMGMDAGQEKRKKKLDKMPDRAAQNAIHEIFSKIRYRYGARFGKDSATRYARMMKKRAEYQDSPSKTYAAFNKKLAAIP